MFSVSIDYTPWLTVPPASAPNVEMVVLPEKIFAVSPNPMTGETAVLFTIPNGAEDVSLHVFDVNGRLVRNLLPTAPPAGLQQVVWDGRDGSGRQAPPGVYFVRYRDQEANKAKKIVRLP
jgi:flagellar hook assembly protein FlgD